MKHSDRFYWRETAERLEDAGVNWNGRSRITQLGRSFEDFRSSRSTARTTLHFKGDCRQLTFNDGLNKNLGAPAKLVELFS